MNKNLIKTIQNTVFQNNLFEKNSKLVVGVSGGPDSTCLLDILIKLQKKYSLDLIIVHVNYGLRGKDSQEDEKFVKNLGEKYDLKIAVLKPKIKVKSNLEDNLRNIRYDFFEKIRKQNAFDYIAVAHNLNDQVETFLIRLLRGSGLAGLSGMKYRNGKIIRPLLGTTRKEILEYLKKNKINYRTDKTNDEDLFLRNKIRNKLIPYLEEEYNPNISETLFNAAESIGKDYDFIAASVDKYKNQRTFSVSEIKKLHPALQKAMIRQTISETKNDLKNIGAAHIEEVLKIINSIKNKKQTVSFGGLKITRSNDRLSISLNF